MVIAFIISYVCTNDLTSVQMLDNCIYYFIFWIGFAIKIVIEIYTSRIDLR